MIGFGIRAAKLGTGSNMTCLFGFEIALCLCA